MNREQKESKDQEGINLVPKKTKLNEKLRKETLCSSSEQLFEQTQSLVSEINAKRKNDTVLLAGWEDEKFLNNFGLSIFTFISVYINQLQKFVVIMIKRFEN